MLKNAQPANLGVDARIRKPTFFEIYDSPIGELLLVATADSLLEIRFEEERRAREIPPHWRQGGTICSMAADQLTAYFAGERQTFELPLSPQGTPFQQIVWKVLQDIPYGKTISYGELAQRIDRPSASRAVGAANGQNPLPIVIPCHRVIGSNGSLTGYGGGLHRKETLLKLERDSLGAI